MASEKITYLDGRKITYSSNTGYPSIWDGEKNVLVHRYVWEKVNGPIPDGYQIHHKDHDRTNFRIDNLELVETREHHRRHALENGLGKSNQGRLKRHSSGFCEGAKEVVLIKGDEILHFDSVRGAANFLEVKQVSDVSRVLTGKRKTISGWRCKYART